MIYLNMSNDGTSVDVSLLGKDHTIKVRTLPEFGKAVGDLGRKYDIDIDFLFDSGFRHSSSMNWPDEYTKDPELLEFVEQLMS